MTSAAVLQSSEMYVASSNGATEASNMQDVFFGIERVTMPAGMMSWLW